MPGTQAFAHFLDGAARKQLATWENAAALSRKHGSSGDDPEQPRRKAARRSSQAALSALVDDISKRSVNRRWGRERYDGDLGLEL